MSEGFSRWDRWVLTTALVAFLAIGALVLFPVFAIGVSASPGRACLSHLKQAVTASHIYADDHDGRLFDANRWQDELLPYTKNTDVLQCIGTKSYGYAFNRQLSGVALSTFTEPFTYPELYDSSHLAANANDSVTSLPKPGRHEGKNTIAYSDGFTKAVWAKPSQ